MPECTVVGPRLRQTQTAVRASDSVGVVIVLPVILPVAHLADVVLATIYNVRQPQHGHRNRSTIPVSLVAAAKPTALSNVAATLIEKLALVIDDSSGKAKDPCSLGLWESFE